MRRKSYYRGGYGGINVGLDAFLPPLVGGGLTAGGVLMIRGFAPKYAKDDAGNVIVENGKMKEHWASRYSGLLGAIPGVVASVILGPFTGWGSSISSGLTAIAVGGTAQLFNIVQPANETGAETEGYRMMVSKRAQQPYSQPYPYKPGSAFAPPKQSYRQLMWNRPVDPQLPENQSAFNANYSTQVNMGAFGGRSW